MPGYGYSPPGAPGTRSGGRRQGKLAVFLGTGEGRASGHVQGERGAGVPSAPGQGAARGGRAPQAVPAVARPPPGSQSHRSPCSLGCGLEAGGAERDTDEHSGERTPSPDPILGEPRPHAALQAETPPRPAPIPGQGRGRCGTSGRSIQLTNFRQDRCAVLRRPRVIRQRRSCLRAGAGGDVTTRPLTSWARGQESCSYSGSERVLASVSVSRMCVCVHICLLWRTSWALEVSTVWPNLTFS